MDVIVECIKEYVVKHEQLFVVGQNYLLKIDDNSKASVFYNENDSTFFYGSLNDYFIISSDQKIKLEKTNNFVGEFISFMDDNKYSFFQDHRSQNNIPSNILFVIDNKSNSSYWLRADGYGNKKHYGNGKICVDEKIVDEVLSLKYN